MKDRRLKQTSTFYFHFTSLLSRRNYKDNKDISFEIFPYGMQDC